MLDSGWFNVSEDLLHPGGDWAPGWSFVRLGVLSQGNLGRCVRVQSKDMSKEADSSFLDGD